MNPVTCCEIGPLKSCVYKSKEEISVVLSLIFILGALFLTLAAAKVLPPGVNAISYLNPFGYILGALLIGAAIYLVKKSLCPPKTDISALPNELLAKILSGVDYSDFPSTARVCHNWNKLSLEAKKEKQKQISENFKNKKPEFWFCDIENWSTKIEINEMQKLIFRSQINNAKVFFGSEQAEYKTELDEQKRQLHIHRSLNQGEFLILHPEPISAWHIQEDFLFVGGSTLIKVWNLRTRECLNHLKIKGIHFFHLHNQILFMTTFGKIYSWHFQKEARAKVVMKLPEGPGYFPISDLQIKDNFLFFITGGTLCKWDQVHKVLKSWKSEIKKSDIEGIEQYHLPGFFKKFHVEEDLIVTFSFNINKGIRLYNHVTEENILEIKDYPDFFKKYSYLGKRTFPLCDSIYMHENHIYFLGRADSKSFVLKYDFN